MGKTLTISFLNLEKAVESIIKDDKNMDVTVISWSRYFVLEERGGQIEISKYQQIIINQNQNYP